MKRASLIAVTLAAIYFLLSFNAYACLLPLYSGAQAAPGSVCAMPQEQPIRDACDAFKALGVQTLSSVQPLPDSLIHAVANDLSAITILVPTVVLHHDSSVGFSLLGRDPLSLTSILRI
ncbi:MAG TPA: hypothetical protein VF879_00830 [Nitrospirales bacterium]